MPEPTTEEVRRLYITGAMDEGLVLEFEAAADFDRWLERVIDESFEDGTKEGHCCNGRR